MLSYSIPKNTYAKFWLITCGIASSIPIFTWRINENSFNVREFIQRNALIHLKDQLR